MNFLRRTLAALLLLSLTGCQKLESTQYGVRFRKLPPFLFGGISGHVVSPGETTFVLPWESLYRLDTSIKDLSWGKSQAGAPAVDGDTDRQGYIHTRALDGNEVALAVTVRYRVIPDPQSLRRLVEDIATDDDRVAEIVSSVARADMRTHMNRLTTDKFLDERERYAAVDEARASMQARLSAMGIEILRVNLDDFRFERMLRDGSVDTSYQDKLTEIQKLHQDTERERSRIETVKAKKLQELNNALAVVNRQVAEAEGYKKQAVLRGDGYFQAKTNEAKGVLATGQAEVTGIIEQINALAGPGGEAILRLELAKQLVKSDPKFVLLAESQNSGNLDVKRVDTNQLLGQIGILEGVNSQSGVSAGSSSPSKQAETQKVVTSKEKE